jgi:hypothetical protein
MRRYGRQEAPASFLPARLTPLTAGLYSRRVIAHPIRFVLEWNPCRHLSAQFRQTTCTPIRPADGRPSLRGCASAAIATEGTAVGSYSQGLRHMHGTLAGFQASRSKRIRQSMSHHPSTAGRHATHDGRPTYPLFMSQLRNTTVRGSKNQRLTVLWGIT